MKKSLLESSVYNVGYKVLNVIFPLITVTYISRILLAEGVGRVAFAQNVVSYFIMIAPLGMSTYGTREVAKLRNKNKDILFSELFIINAISTLFFSVLYFLMISNITALSNEWTLYMIAGQNLVFNIFNIDWYYQGEEEYKYITIRSCIIKCVSIVMIFGLIHNESDVELYMLILVFGTVGNYIMNVYNIRKKIKLVFYGIELRKHIVPLLILSASVIAIELYSAINTTMLGIWRTDSEVGYYSVAIKLIKIIQTTISAIGIALLPRLSYLYEKGSKIEFENLINKSLEILLLISLPACVGIFFVADKIVPILFGNSFLASIEVIQILTFSLPFLVFNVLFGIQVLIPFGKEKEYFITVLFGAITNVLLAPLLINLYGSNGVAIATVICELVVTIVTFFFVRKHITVRFDRNFVSSMVLGICVMCSCLVLFDINTYNPIVNLMLQVIIGVIIYIIVLVITKNKILYEAYLIIKKSDIK